LILKVCSLDFKYFSMWNALHFLVILAMCAGIMQIFYLIPAGEVPGINVHGGNVLLIQSERARQVALFKKPGSYFFQFISPCGHFRTRPAGLSNGAPKLTNTCRLDISAVNISFIFFGVITFASSGIPCKYRSPSCFILKS